MSENNDYTTGNLLDYFYHQNYYKLIGIDLSRQTNKNIPQQINFTRKKIVPQCFYFVQKQPKTVLNLSLDSLIFTE